MRVLRGKHLTDMPITDCRVLVQSAVVDVDGFKIDVALIRDEETYTGILDGDTLEHAGALNSWAMRVGMCNWNLDKHSVVALKTFIMKQAQSRHVVFHVAKAGYIKEWGVWIGQQHCIDALGRVLPAGADGSFTLKCSDKITRAIHPPDPESVNMPTYPSAEIYTHSKASAELRMAFSTIPRFWRNNASIQFAFGWAFAHIFRDTLFRVKGCFPHLYLYGESGSGKNFLGVILFAMFGCEGFKEIMAPAVTANPKGVRNQLSTTFNIPLWVDELRNEQGTDTILNIIRSSYNGSSAPIARLEGATKTYGVGRSMILSGEHLVGREAEHRRYVTVLVDKTRGDITDKAIVKLLPRLRTATTSIVALRNKLESRVVRWARINEDLLLAAGVDPLLAWPWAIAMTGLRIAGWSEMVDTAPADAALPPGALQDAVAAATSATVTRDRDGSLGQFWGVLESLEASGKLRNTEKQTWIRGFWVDANGPRWAREMDLGKISPKVVRQKNGEFLPDGPCVAIWLPFLHQQACTESVMRRNQAWPYDAVLRTFEGSRGFLAGPVSLRLSPIEGHPRRNVILLRWSSEFTHNLPDWVRDNVEDHGFTDTNGDALDDAGHLKRQ